MDNRVFNVNGNTSDMLLQTLQLAFAQDGIVHPATCRGWVVTDKGLVLLSYISSTDKGAQKFPASDRGLTAAQVQPMVIEWLKSEEAATIKLEGWDCNMDHDGHNTMGWRVFVEDWGHVGHWHSAICAITPAYMWHGK